MIKNKLLFSLLFLTISFNIFNIKAKAENELPESNGVWDTIENGFPHTEMYIQHTRIEEIEENMQEIEQMLHPNRWDIQLTDNEKEMLAQITYLEAGNQGIAGQEYVIAVIFNRMINDKYPSSLYEVLSQKDPVQFTTWKYREISTPTKETYQAIENMLNGTADEYIMNSTFHSFGLSKGSKNAVKIGDHWFW